MNDFDIIAQHEPDTDEEIALKGMLAELQRRYQLEAEPIVKRLAELGATKPVRYHFVVDPASKTAREMLERVPLSVRESLAKSTDNRAEPSE